MKKSFQIKIIDSFQISNLRTIVFVQNENAGLPTDSILKSGSGKSWVVKNRIIEFPDLENPEFDEETTTHLHLKFSSLENKTESEQQAVQRIFQNIYQYQLEGIGHDEKPAINEELEVVVPDDGQLRIVSFDNDDVYVVQRFTNEILPISKHRVFRNDNLAVGLYLRYCEHHIYDIVDVYGNFVFGGS